MLLSADKVSFEHLDLGSGKPTSVPFETVVVQITNQALFGNYAKAFVKEAFRLNPLRAEQIELSAQEVEDYCKYLLTQRIAAVEGNCPEWRKLKALYIPSWIQYNLSMIGIVVLRDRGLKLVPEMEEPSTMEYGEALKISEKIGMLIDDLQIVTDAMPRGDEGDVDVMSTALIAGYVRALFPVEHVASTYVTAFLGMKLKEEVAMRTLYRIQYDDLEFIASALTTQRGLY
jgi:hypothetical protein